MISHSVPSFFLACALASSLILVAVHHVSGHGAMTFPKPRNALDGALDPWAQWAYPCDDKHQGDMCKITFCEDGKNCQGSCPISAHSGSKNALNAKIVVYLRKSGVEQLEAQREPQTCHALLT